MKSIKRSLHKLLPSKINQRKKKQFFKEGALIAVRAGVYEKDFFVVLGRGNGNINACWVIWSEKPDRMFDELNMVDLPETAYNDGINSGILDVVEILPKKVLNGLKVDIQTRKRYNAQKNIADRWK